MAKTLDLPAPIWLVSCADWISRRWWFPAGMVRVWSFANGELALRKVFGEPTPPVTWAHFLGRPYRR